MRQHIDRLENELHMRHPEAKPPEPPPAQPEKNKEEPQGKTAL